MYVYSLFYVNKWFIKNPANTEEKLKKYICSSIKEVSNKIAIYSQESVESRVRVDFTYIYVYVSNQYLQ